MDFYSQDPAPPSHRFHLLLPHQHKLVLRRPTFFPPLLLTLVFFLAFSYWCFLTLTRFRSRNCKNNTSSDSNCHINYSHIYPFVLLLLEKCDIHSLLSELRVLGFSLVTYISYSLHPPLSSTFGSRLWRCPHTTVARVLPCCYRILPVQYVALSTETKQRGRKESSMEEERKQQPTAFQINGVAGAGGGGGGGAEVVG